MTVIMMVIREVDGAALTQMLYAGAAVLDGNLKKINDLNVFPVPDGDTGTNMEFTIKGALRGAQSASGSLSEVAKAMAKGALLGARGNSGVILSQFLKGISVGVDGLEKADTKQFAQAFKTGVEYAYKSVLHPTEGTILTVMREATEYATEKIAVHGELTVFLSDFIEEALRSLNRTPELLAVLKKAGVVDSGAAGLICVIEGFSKAANGEEITSEMQTEQVQTKVDASAFGPDSVLEYGYCTEFILQLMNAKTDIPSFKIETIIDYLKTVGDSIVAILDDSVVKIHVHTKTPAKVIEFCQRFGEFVTFKMENMSVQHNEIIAEAAVTEEKSEEQMAEHVKNAVVAVVSGDGIRDMFVSLGANAVVNGGQTMNPSSEDFITAFDKLKAENIIVLPNNSNIYLAAKQAAELYDKAKVFVVNAHTVAEGYSAMTVADAEADVEDILRDMERACAHVDTLSVTYAVRDGSMDGVSYKKDDYIAVCGKNMLFASNDKVQTLAGAVKSFPNIADKEIITVIYGEDVSAEEKESLKNVFEKEYSDKELYEIDGGQDIYSFIVALE